jgi:hypothetical protein
LPSYHSRTMTCSRISLLEWMSVRPHLSACQVPSVHSLKLPDVR